MKFPLLSEIASRKVISIDISRSIFEALNLMLDNNHRNIIVMDGSIFKILTIMDVLSARKTNPNLDLLLLDLPLEVVPTATKDKNILDVLEYLNNSVEHICVINTDNSLYGLVTHTDISSNIDPDTLMDNYRLKDFLKLGRRIKWVNKDEVTSSLLQRMSDNAFDNVVVVENMCPVGILTTKDVMSLMKNKENLSLTIDNFMTSPVQTVCKDASVREALNFLKDKHFRRVIVTDENNKLIGVITQKELISLTYSKWALLMKDYQEELTELNQILESKYRESETKASTDALTGLYNRHKFAELYVSSYKSMLQRNNDMSLILLDIDYFKVVNDTYGHNQGDKVLIQLSHVLLRTLRNIDVICRWGGEEFIILLPTANLSKASTLAEKLRVSIQEMQIDIVGQVTVSFGTAQVIAGESMESLIARADEALYLAKSSGRNCVKTELDI